MAPIYRIRFRQAETEFEVEGDRVYVTKTYHDLKEILGLSELAKPVLSGQQKPSKVLPAKSFGGKASSPREFIDRYGLKRHVDIVLAFGYFLGSLPPAEFDARLCALKISPPASSALRVCRSNTYGK